MLGFFNRSIERHEQEIMMLKAQVMALKAMVEDHHVEYIRVRRSSICNFPSYLDKNDERPS